MKEVAMELERLRTRQGDCIPLINLNKMRSVEENRLKLVGISLHSQQIIIRIAA
ncbi:hypothetical protein Golob_004688 [Gossypium lobatum]|uniref:Uncharacterized protein n=1 Tax=Gossypium lobatum TaxID=34289 RepID=A0A7J8N2G1_9ROSI|nr:hypothetical protein [Gossypium lobatum]